MAFFFDTVKVGERGQIVLPKRVRDAEGIEAHENVRVIDMNGYIFVKKEQKAGRPGDVFLKILRKYPISDKDWKEMQRLRHAER